MIHVTDTGFNREITVSSLFRRVRIETRFIAIGDSRLLLLEYNHIENRNARKPRLHTPHCGLGRQATHLTAALRQADRGTTGTDRTDLTDGQGQKPKTQTCATWHVTSNRHISDDVAQTTSRAWKTRIMLVLRDLIGSTKACHSEWQCKMHANASKIPAYIPPGLAMAQNSAPIAGRENMRENVKNATVDGMLQYMIGFEPFMLVLQGEVLQASCAPGTDGSRPVFVDSGANEGLWSVLAGSLGCHVISVEPQPTCIEWIKQSLALNPLAERHVHIWHHFLGVDANATLSVDADACTGSQQILVQPQANRSSALMVQPKANQSANRSYALAMNAVALARARTRVNVTAARLDASAYLRSTSPASHIALWHLDTEGAEVFVLRSADPTLTPHRVPTLTLPTGPPPSGLRAALRGGSLRARAHRPDRA